MPDTISPDIIYSDTVIVGGGIAGLYACHKLKQLNGANHTISLFESSNRFGGRIETVEMGGFLAEYGPMRFEKLAQPLLMDLMAELGLDTKQFVPDTAAKDPDSLFDITFYESGGKRHGNKLTTLKLLELAILRLLNARGEDMNQTRVCLGVFSQNFDLVRRHNDSKTNSQIIIDKKSRKLIILLKLFASLSSDVDKV